MRVLYIGPVFKPSGYGVAATMNFKALVATPGVDVRFVCTEPTVKVPGWAQQYIAGAPGWEDIIVVHAVPTVLPVIAKELDPTIPRVAYTTWESIGFPQDLLTQIWTDYDKVLVPSQWCAAQMIQGKTPLVVPHAFEPAIWKEVREKRKLKKTPFRFLTVLTWNERKNPIGLLKAYFHAFQGRQDVLLSIVTPSYSSNEVKDLMRGAGAKTPLPPVEFLGVLKEGGRMSDKAYRRAFQESHAYVSAARSEGWGLGAMEACAAGLPYVGVCHSGLEDFLLDCAPVARLCFHREEPVFYPPTIGSTTVVNGVRIKAVVRNAHEGARGDQLWYEPGIPHLAAAMRNLVKDYTSLTHAYTFDQMVDRYSPEAVGKRLVEVLS